MDTQKKCSKCDNVKPLAEFYKNKRSPGGHRPNCKQCHNKVTAIYMQTDKYKAYKKKYDQEQYYPVNREAILERARCYYQENKESVSERNKLYNQENREAIADKRKQYYQANKSTLMSAMVKYARERRANDPLFSLTHNIRSLIGRSLTNGGFSKKSKTAEILGCTFKEYYNHIEAQFTDGMSWDLMDEIHIDHRLPLSAANTEEEILVLNHHRNLQPMWATDNLAKSDSYCPDELAAYFKKHLPS